MRDISNPVVYVLVPWSIITAALVSMVAYRAALSRTEDDSLYLNKAEEALMVGQQDVLIAKVDRLRRPIVTLAVLSSILLLASAGLWLWTGFKSF